MKIISVSGNVMISLNIAEAEAVTAALDAGGGDTADGLIAEIVRQLRICTEFERKQSSMPST